MKSPLSQSSQLYSSHSEKSIANERTLISNHITRTKQNNTKVFFSNETKSFEVQGVNVLEGDRWNVNSIESIDKDFLIQDYD